SAHEIAAGPTVYGSVEFTQQLERVGAKPVNIVGRHQRCRADMDHTSAKCPNHQPRVVRTFPSLQGEGFLSEFAACTREYCNRFVLRAVSPLQRNFNPAD